MKRVLSLLKRTPRTETRRGESSSNEMHNVHKRRGLDRDNISGEDIKEEIIEIEEEIKSNAMAKTSTVLNPNESKHKSIRHNYRLDSDDEHEFGESGASLPSYPQDAEFSTLSNKSDDADEDDDVLDVLGQMVAQYMKLANEEAPTMNPDSFVPGSLSEMEDDPSVLAIPRTVISSSTRSLHNDMDSPSDECCMSYASLQFQEDEYFQTIGQQDPDIDFVRDVVRECMQVNNDKQAVEIARQALMDTDSMDLALFCLTALWVLVRKTDENKRRVLYGSRNEETRDDETPFAAIIATMMNFESAEIQTRACEVIWSLSINQEDRKDVAQLGGCQAILQAMLMHTDDEPLQIMALGALKVLSDNDVGQSSLRRISASSVVAASMSKHITNPTVQSKGSAIICNLATGPNPVTKVEIDAIVNSILTHIDLPSIQEGAILTLMNLSSSTVNVEIMRHDPKLHEALDLSFTKHPEKVGRCVQVVLENIRAPD
ncbi:hypothetical protein ACHAXN_000450 [Cyclotella atomus]